MRSVPPLAAKPSLQLVVLDPEPADVLSWVAQETAEAVLALDPKAEDLAPAVNLPAGLRGHGWSGDGGLTIVRVPLDGPPAALLTVVSALGARLHDQGSRLAVVPETTPWPPPTPDLLAQVAGSGAIPGADIEGFDWVADHAVWLTGLTGMAHLRYRIAKPSHSHELAELICTLDVLGPDSPAGRWANDVATHRTYATPAAWQSALRAIYVEAVMAGIRRAG